jgi:hypothetical protein
MKHVITTGAAALTLCALGAMGAAQAETVGIAASKKGSLYDRAGTVIAKVATNKGGLRATLRNFTSPNVYIPTVNKGQVDFGLANEYELSIAVTGEGHFKGRKHPNLRAVFIMFPLRNGFWVRKDSKYKTIADLKGARSPDGYVAQKIILNLIDAHLETAGLTRKDLRPVPVPNIVAGANAFIAGKTDVFLFAMGAPKVREANAKIGIRALAIPNTPENLAKMRKHMPVAYFRREVPGKHNPGVTKPMYALTYDALVFAHKGTSAEKVYQLVKTMHDNKKAMAAAWPVYNLFNPKRMNKNMGPVAWHEGAIKYYKEQGLWPPK